MKETIFNEKCYAEGFKAWYEHARRNYISSISNPYPKESNEWKNWNKGWNINQKGIEKCSD